VIPVIIASAQTSVSQALSGIATSIIDAIPSIIVFIIILIIGYIIANIVSYSIRAFLGRIFREEHVRASVDIIAGTIKALIILIALSIALSFLQLGAASGYVQQIANYLPKLAGAIVLLTIGLTLVNILVDYMQRQIGARSQDDLITAIFNVLRFGLYAAIITVAAALAIFSVIPYVDPYVFYAVILGAVILYAAYALIDKVLVPFANSNPDLAYVANYGRLILYIIVLLIAIAIIVEPFGNVTSIIYALSWGLAIAFAIALIPLVIALVKKFLAEIK
jgi:Conserved TM helix.